MSAPQPVDYDALIAGAREEADVVGKTNAWRLLLYCADAIETLLRQKREVLALCEVCEVKSKLSGAPDVVYWIDGNDIRAIYADSEKRNARRSREI